MEASLTPSLRTGRLDRLVKPLQALASGAPALYSDWGRLAREGAAAAARNDAGSVRAACGACHGTYRARYRAEMRAAPLPSTLRGDR